MNISGLAAGTVLALASALIAAQTSPTPLVAFTHVAIIDGTGAPLKRDQTIVVRGSHIDVVGPFAVTQVPVEARIIDATGKFMIPGLWDMHVHTHYQGIDHLRLFIAHGITSVRDMGGGSEHLGRINEWTRQIERGTITGPRIIPGGVLLDGPTSRWFHAHRISGPAEGQDAVRRLKGEGAAFVKVYDQLNHEAFVAIADAAKQHGLPIFGHIVAAVGVEAAVAAGQRSVEHANAVARAASDQAEGNSPGTVSDEKARALAEYLHRHGTAVVPTLSLVAQFARWTEKNAAATTESAALRYVPPGYVGVWKATEPFSTGLDNALRMTSHLIQARVEVLAGTDVVKPFFIPGVSLHDELTLLVRAGMSNMQALQAATVKPASFLGIRQLGTIESRKIADMVLLDANPLEDISNTRKIASVTVGGRFHDRSALDRMLAQVERDATAWKGTPTPSAGRQRRQH